MAWHTIEMRREENEQGPQFYARKTQSGVEIVCWKGGYPIKDSLKGRGYRFSEVYTPDAGPKALLGMDILNNISPSKGWAKTITNESEADEEQDWLTGQGYNINVLPPKISMLNAPIEGRRDIMPE